VGCGEKSILRATTSVTETYMQPLYHKKTDRLHAKAEKLEKKKPAKLTTLKQRSKTEYQLFHKTFTHIIIKLKNKNNKNTTQQIEKHDPISDKQIIKNLVAMLRQNAFNHRDLQAIDNHHANNMNVVFINTSTNYNTIYNSTPPSNPHPYP